MCVNTVTATLAAILVFWLWYPPPYDHLAGGLTLFGLIVIVDAVCGPLLTLIVFDQRKPRNELVRDLMTIGILQFSALVYGIYAVAQARPVFLAYEGNRYRVVTAIDVNSKKLMTALPQYRNLSWTGPRLVGAKLAQPTDPDYRASVIESIEGLPPSFRPERWVPYRTLLSQLERQLRPIALLKLKHPTAAKQIEHVLAKHHLTDENAGYLPLDATKATPADWSVIVKRSSGSVEAFLPLDGW